MKGLKCAENASTMVLLKMFDFTNLENTPGASAFHTVNQGNMTRASGEPLRLDQRVLLLNRDQDNPMQLLIPGENDQQPLSTITPSITFQGAISSAARALGNGAATRAITTPERDPMTEEKIKVRVAVQRAFEAFYGDVDNQDFQNAVRSITSEENARLPMRVGDVVAIFNLIPEHVRIEEPADSAVSEVLCLGSIS